jgi:hypothetical protein
MRDMRAVLGAMLAVVGIAGLFLLGACGGGSETEPTSEASSPLREIVASKLAAALGLGGEGAIGWEKENTSAWKDAELFANRILGEVQVPSLEEMKITVVKDETAGDARTVVVRVEVVDLTADYRISMRKADGQWKVTNYEVEEIVEAMGR